MTPIEWALQGAAAGVAGAWLLSRLLERRRSSRSTRSTSYWRDPDVAAATRKMLAERDAEVLRSAGHVAPEEPHRQGPRVPSRAGRQLDEE